MTRFLFPALLAAASALSAAPALVSATPAAGASVASPATIELRFSERLAPAVSGATVTMTAMPGMADHPPMRIPVAASVGKDGTTLLLKPSKRMPAGSYRVDWHAAAGAAPPATGTHLFAVK